MATTPKIKINLDLVEASVTFPDSFNALDPLVRCDILKDILFDVQSAYDEATHDLKKSFENIHAKSLLV